MMRRVWWIGVLLPVLIVGGICRAAGPRGGEGPVIRVAVLKDVRGFRVWVSGGYRLLDGRGRLLASGRRLRGESVAVSASGFVVGAERFPGRTLRIEAPKGVRIAVKRGRRRRYRGRLDLVRGEDGTMIVVNRLPLEDYIRGVLYHEVSHRWPMQAIMAQAVAARSYALYRMETNASRPYDVTNDVFSQVYGGRTSEHYRTNLAVERTRGEILIYRGKVLPAYYSAACGGMRADARELWGHEDLPPLHGGPCRFCRRSPHFHWKKNLRLKDVQEKLNASGRHLGLIREIAVVERTASGRAARLKILTRDGKEVFVSGKDFRRIIGPNVIKSNLYRIEMKGYYMDVIGRGWGHGVGLCQWGAREMAARRYDYREILAYYYPGAVLTRWRPEADAVE